MGGEVIHLGSRGAGKARRALDQQFERRTQGKTPDPQRLDHHGQLGQVAALLADPAPVPARLLARHAALFADQHPLPFASQRPGRHQADDAAADHGHVHRIRQRADMLGRGGKGDGEAVHGQNLPMP